MTLADVFEEMANTSVQVRRCQPAMAVLVLGFSGGRRLMLLERTYREGLTAILDPTADEMEIARGGDLWDLWNSDRRQPLGGIA